MLKTFLKYKKKKIENSWGLCVKTKLIADIRIINKLNLKLIIKIHFFNMFGNYLLKR